MYYVREILITALGFPGVQIVAARGILQNQF